jgi:hypothetical protein
MTKRLTVTLTEAQWDALMEAVGNYHLELEDQIGTLSEGEAMRRAAVLTRAEDKLRAAAEGR